MGKRRSILQQLNYCVSSGVALGESKRSAQRNGTADGKLFSVAHLDSIRHTAKRLGEYCKGEGIRAVYEINGQVIQGYLDSRARSCNRETLGKELSYCSKLQALARHVYPHSAVDFGLDSVKVPTGRASSFSKNRAMPLDVSGQVVEVMRGQRSGAWRCVVASVAGGLRANEAGHLRVADVHFTGGRYNLGYIVVRDGPTGGAKGGRARVADIYSPMAQKALQGALQGFQGPYMAGASPLTSSAVCKQTRLALQRLGLADAYKGVLVHGIRKQYAQGVYDCERRAGRTPWEASRVVNVELGHGDNRKDLTSVYVLNRW